MEIPVPVQPSWLRRASAPLPGLSAPGRLFDQRFGEGLLEAELAALCPAALAPYYLRAPSVALPTAQVSTDPGHFSVLLDVKHFSPEEIAVKVVGDHVEVHARHEERPDEHGYIAREFHRRYRLPPGVDPAAVTSALSPEGVLSIQAAPAPAQAPLQSPPGAAAK
ncbi:heat shock protein beta-6 isoform X2 [Bos indicus]|uniref:Heat shock protein beta-6 n=14 Tax=Pecora TaxID=35500 RepID=A0A6P7ESN6_SHEEP|nr:PREDICTED: heat shock protein beta-6 [Bison bison bison]XP_013826674.2 PREDICTED: heat shock protein beta-6 [Capra hircus]XP_027370186.1 heat shock protein beta-6 isoform X2 [Bos indicus x Bos taurus]XP_027833244.1 heat shock protein beta-6 [Ovis aries]XP_043293440.1 heat shock protein beta-6 [Cervus canadensis]XP_043749859.1 heat shock protein beta-6 [Cervus elaphus]XP_055266952.1 heat shock protein beta-6 [Moschus berezovskii]AAI26730.1 Heat shock protein, alpha-crystallin-related, B6 [